MKPLVPIQRDPAASARLRLRLLATPAEDFRPYFGGRLPTPEEKLAYIEREVHAMANGSRYGNDVYEVEMSAAPPFVCLTISRLDGRPCEEWSELQQIKNELVGLENEAVRLFPKDGQDTERRAECCLWVHTDPLFRFTGGSVAQSFLVPATATFAVSIENS